MKEVTIVYGGPGTGKTYTLLQLLKEEMRTTPIRKIAYVSFTRQGTYQGVDLAKQEFELTDEECSYFKTIHSLCFHACDLSAKDLFTGRPLEVAMKHLDMNKQAYTQLSTIQSIIRNKMREPNLKDFKRFNGGDIDAITSCEFLDELREKTNKKDFTDMLEDVINNCVQLPVDVVFIDEAQDLTFLQWKVCETLFANAKKWILAGDPNQSIYAWAGADAKRLIGMQRDKEIFLDRSRRCCEHVWRYARITHIGIHDKIPMPDECNEEEGFAWTMRFCPEKFIARCIHYGSVMCLAYTNNKLQAYIDTCVHYGLPYIIRSNRDESSLTDATIKWLRFLHDVFTDEEMYRKYVTWKDDPNAEASRNNHKLRTKRDNIGNVIKQYNLEFGWTENLIQCITDELKKKIKFRKVIGFDKLEEAKQDRYCRELAETKNFLLNPILISPVHRVKGGEADYVFVNDAVGRLVKLNNREEKDNALRVLYVAITRARKGVIVWHEPKSRTCMTTLSWPKLGALPPMLDEMTGV